MGGGRHPPATASVARLKRFRANVGAALEHEHCLTWPRRTWGVHLVVRRGWIPALAVGIRCAVPASRRVSAPIPAPVAPAPTPVPAPRRATPVSPSVPVPGPSALAAAGAAVRLVPRALRRSLLDVQRRAVQLVRLRALRSQMREIKSKRGSDELRTTSSVLDEQ